jgi:3-oxoacyl-[acyl-carrier-protein] synthase-3
MNYQRVFIEAIGYELPPVVVSTAELEERLRPIYEALRLPLGQIEALTGITERRWWESDFPLSQGATLAAKKALAQSSLTPNDIDILIYAGVCREHFEPATACRVASGLGINPDATVYDLSNACIGVLNGMIEVANRIELGQCRAGLVVSCETAREINETMIARMNQTKSLDVFKQSIATLTGGSGAVAVLVVSDELASGRRRLVGGVNKTAPQYHNLCRWGLDQIIPGAYDRLVKSEAAALVQRGYEFSLRHWVEPFMATDAGAVLKYGVELATRTFKSFLAKMGCFVDRLDKVICHQVGAGHREAVLHSLGIPREKDFSTFEFLGNIGTVSLPLTAALAEEQMFLRPGDNVGFLGIGSGLNCMMLGLEW